MGTLLSDLRFALRTAQKNPGFSLTAILTLALGIGAVSALVSVVQAVLLNPFPFRDQDELVVLWGEMKAQQGHLVEVSSQDYWDWREMNRSFSGIAAFAATDSDLTLTGGDRPLPVRGRLVSANFFDVLGTRAVEGRTFLPAEDQPSGETGLVVLSHGLWRREFGGDPKVIGRQISIDNLPSVVIGVMPPDFRFPEEVDLWQPLATVFASPPLAPVRFLKTVARLKPGTSLEAARQDMSVVSTRLAEKRPQFNQGYSTVVTPLLEEILGDTPRTLWTLMGAVGLLLVIACTNVAGLLVARAAARQKETAVRGALGAGRSRLVRQLLTEGAVLAAAAAVIGLFLAWAGLKLLIALAPGEIPRLDEVRLSAPVVGITLLVAALTVLLFALAPALQALGRDFTQALKEGGKASAGSGSSRLRSLLVVAEVALALILLVAAGLLLRSFLHLKNTDLGFQPESLLSQRITLARAKYPQGPPQWAAFFRETLTRVEALPGVESAGLVLMRPLSGPIGWDFDFTVEGQTAEEQEKNPVSNHQRVSPGYFKTMGMRVLKGREFAWSDGPQGQRVVIVNRSTAERYWPGQDPLGKRLRFGPYDAPAGPNGQPPPWFTVVGVVADAKYRDLGPARPDLYVPFLQVPNWAMDLLVRSSVPPLTLADDIGRVVQQLDPDQAVAEVTTMEQAVADTIARPRLRSGLLAAFAALALVLSAVGLYGIIAYSVAQRRRELGIRVALGADRPDLLRLILRFGIGLSAVGVALGLVASILMAGTGWIDELLYGVKPGDVLTFAAVPLLLLAVAALASFVPARRATKVDPLVVLRAE